MKYSFRLSIFALGVLLQAVSCRMLESVFSGDEKVTVLLPSIPPAAERAGITGPVWTVRWYPDGFTPREQTVYGRNCVITLEKGKFTPVLAELKSTDPRYGPYPAAGSLYPALARSSPIVTELHADWVGGTAATAAEKALLSAYGGTHTAAIILSRFNWKRLAQEIGEMEHPEHIDYTRLVPAILSGDFRVYDVKSQPLRAFRITLPNHAPGPGEEFVSAWPGRTAFIWPGDEGVSVKIPDGMSRFYGLTGCITVQTGGEIADNTFFMPYSLQEADSSGTVKWYENVRHGDCLHHVVDLMQATHHYP